MNRPPARYITLLVHYLSFLSRVCRAWAYYNIHTFCQAVKLAIALEIFPAFPHLIYYQIVPFLPLKGIHVCTHLHAITISPKP